MPVWLTVIYVCIYPLAVFVHYLHWKNKYINKSKTALEARVRNEER